MNDRGRTAAAEALGVNYRTVARCQQSRRVSRLMRQVLVEFRDSQDVGDGGPPIVDGDGAAEDVEDTAELRVAALQLENRELRETAEDQAEELETLGGRVAELEEWAQDPGKTDAIEGSGKQPEDWRPLQRGQGSPDAGVVTLEEQPDEAHFLGTAAPLVVEWRNLRTGGDQAVSRVERAAAQVRRWELEVKMLRDWQLTLPPEMEPLDASRRQD